MTDNTEQIRGLLEEIKSKTVEYDRETMRHKGDILVSEIRNCANDTLSLLPKPCETCRGSRKICGGCGKSTNDIRPYRGKHWTGGEYGRPQHGWILCGDIAPCPACQPAGEVEEFIEESMPPYRPFERPSNGGVREVENKKKSFKLKNKKD